MVKSEKLEKESLNPPTEQLTSIWLKLFDMLDQLVSIIDDDFNIVKINKKMYESFGDVVGKKCYEVFHSTDSPLPYCQVIAFKEDRGDVGEFFEKSLEKWIRVKVREVELKGKKFFLHIVEDVTERKNLELELSRQKVFSKSIVENAASLILAFDKSGKAIIFNKTSERLTGILKQEANLERFLEFIPEDERKKMIEFFNKVRKEGHSELITSFKSTNGKKRLWWQGKKISWDSEEIIVLVGNDITEAERIKRELRESDEKYRTLVEKGHDATYIFKDDKFIFVNDRASELTGYTKDELYSMNPFSLVHQEDRERLIESGRKRLQGEKVPELFDARIVTKDGKIRYVNFSVSRINYHGEPAILGTVRDYTEKKLIEDELKKSEEKYRSLVETMDDIVFSLDLKGRFTFLNKKFEEKTGHKIEELIGKHFTKILISDYIGVAKKSFETGIKGKETPLLRVEIMKSDGSKLPVEVNATNLYDKGRIVGRIGVARDISERVRMEMDINKRTELLKLINKILRHDIANDLAVIAGAKDLLTTDIKDKEKKELLEIIGLAVRRSADLINKMRELEDLTIGGELKPVKVHEIAKEVFNEFKIECKLKGGVKGECIVKADDALKTVFNNLIRNAVVHGKTDRVDITIKKMNGFCEIKIVDFGKGIPDEVGDRVFEEGFTYGETGKAGLGLYIVKKVIERYGGEVFIEDNIPKGTVFVLRIPSV